MVTSMTHWRGEELAKFATAAAGLARLRSCRACGMWSEPELCDICSNPRRTNSGVICVVEQVSDLLAIEKSGQFQGRFLVLGGVLNPLLGVGPDQLRFMELREMVGESTSTVILALNPSVEGDATCAYIKHFLPPATEVERIGFGMPIGGSLEHLDPMTIGKALENRKTF
jgi:recombination protein RecR